MARSALVIGLGGTGQWIATYLKKDLLESNNGALPPNVRLLSFDTMLQQEASVAQMSNEEEKIEVGSVQLEPGTEFIPLADDVYELAEQVRDGQLNQIGTWFAAKRWLADLPRANFILKNGAGQLRQFGRLTIFNDLGQGLGNSIIWRSLTNALNLIGSVASGQTIEIFIVGSFAGGTGSGMFIDMGWLARQAAQNQSVAVRGYFVLPGAFVRKGQDRPMLARTFAAWRELNRFMTLNDEEGLPTLIFDPEQQQLQVPLKKRVYDACYLIDGTRGQSDVAEDPKRSIFPSVADAISAVLDDRGGVRYTDYVLTNLGREYVANRGKPLYSTLSTCTYKVPVYYLRQEFAHAFSRTVVETLLGVIKTPDGGVPLLSTQVGSKIGFDSALDLLTAPVQRFGSGPEEETAYANQFTQKIADISNKGGIRNAQLLQDSAAAFQSRSGIQHSMVTPVTDFGDDPNAVKMKKEVKDEVGFVLSKAVMVEPRKSGGLLGGKEKPRDVIARIQPQIDKLLWEHYGGQVAGGGEFTGTLGEALDKAQEYQLDNYRRLIRLWVLSTLMGDSQTDFVKARGGKLGYAISFMEGLIYHLDEALKFMAKVQEMVVQQKPALKLSQKKAGREARMIAEADRKMLWFTHPQAYNNIDDYMQASQDVAFSRREAITHRAITETIELMQEYTVLVKDEVERWARLLFDGNPALGLPGLYSEVERNLNAIRATHEADRSIDKAQKLLLDSVPPVSAAELQAIMSGVLWQAEAGPQRFYLKLSLQPPGQSAIALQQLTEKANRSKAVSLTQRNLGEMLGVGMRRYPVNMENEQQVAVILPLQEPDPKKFAEGLLVGYDQTLIKRRPGSKGPLKRSNFIRVATGKNPEAVTYFRDMEAHLREKSSLPPNALDATFPIEVVDSADLHKLTMVRTDDLWAHTAFSSWHDCFGAYKEEISRPNQDPAQYHAYAPEMKAVSYELQLEKLRQEYRAFHPRVVHLLEYSTRLEQFYLAWALGYFERLGDGISEMWWELAVPGSRYRLQMTPKWRSEPDDFIFNLANNYVLIGRDLTPGVKSMINYGEVGTAIKKSRAELGKDGMMAKIRYELTDPRGLMNRLQEAADIRQEETIDGELREEVGKPEFLDFKDLGRLIYFDELQALGYLLADVEEGRV